MTKAVLEKLTETTDKLMASAGKQTNDTVAALDEREIIDQEEQVKGLLVTRL